MASEDDVINLIDTKGTFEEEEVTESKPSRVPQETGKKPVTKEENIPPVGSATTSSEPSDIDQETETTTPTDPSSSEADTFRINRGNACASNLVLDKRLKILRTRVKTLWVFWLDSILGSTKNTYTISNLDGNAAFSTEQVSDEESLLYFTNTDDEFLQMTRDGILNSNMYWAVYFDQSINKYRPIIGAKYFDMWYDPDLQIIDLVFWANIDKEVLETTLDDLTLYPDSLEDQLDSSGNVNTAAQRVLFYSRGSYREVITNRTGKEQIFSMFLFSKPVILMHSEVLDDQSNGDVVLDTIPGFRFVEFSS